MDLSYSDEPREDGGILIRGRLKHLPSGHFEDSFMPAPLDTTGGKSDVQAVGEHQFFPAPLRRLQHLQHCRRRRMMTTELGEQSTRTRPRQFLT